MRKFIYRIIFVIMIFITLSVLNTKPTFALSDMITSAQNFLRYGDDVEDVIDTDRLANTSDFIFNTFLVIAIVIAVIIGTVLGVKFITGSIEGQAKIKEAMIPYIVGCIVIFSAFPIWSFIVNAGQDTTENPTLHPANSKYCKYCGGEWSEKELKAGICKNCGKFIDYDGPSKEEEEKQKGGKV